MSNRDIKVIFLIILNIYDYSCIYYWLLEVQSPFIFFCQASVTSSMPMPSSCMLRKSAGSCSSMPCQQLYHCFIFSSA